MLVRSGPVRSPILLHLRRRLRQTLRPLLLRPHLLRRALPHDREDHVRRRHRLAGLLLLRHPLPDLSHLVQLDRLRPDHELPRHVRLPERDRHRAGHHHPLFTGLQHQPAADESQQEDRLGCNFWLGHLLRRQQHRAIGLHGRISLPGPLP